MYLYGVPFWEVSLTLHQHYHVIWSSEKIHICFYLVKGANRCCLANFTFFFCFAITLFLIIFIVLVYFALQFSTALNFLCFPYIYKHFHFVYQNDFSKSLVSFLILGFISDVFHCHDFFLSVSYSLNRYPNPLFPRFLVGFSS